MDPFSPPSSTGANAEGEDPGVASVFPDTACAEPVVLQEADSGFSPTDSDHVLYPYIVEDEGDDQDDHFLQLPSPKLPSNGMYEVEEDELSTVQTESTPAVVPTQPSNSDVHFEEVVLSGAGYSQSTSSPPPLCAVGYYYQGVGESIPLPLRHYSLCLKASPMNLPY